MQRKNIHLCPEGALIQRGVDIQWQLVMVNAAKRYTEGAQQHRKGTKLLQGRWVRKGFSEEVIDGLSFKGEIGITQTEWGEVYFRQWITWTNAIIII